MGLTSWAADFLDDNSPLVFTETTKRFPDGTIKKSYYEKIEHVSTVYNHYYGMFGCEYDLHEYTLNDGRIIQEYVQADPWSSGPVFFLALRWKDGEPLPESLWPQSSIDGA